MTQLVHHEVRLAGLGTGASGLVAVQLSDLHYGPLTREREIHRAVAAANRCAPDLICMTGDFVTDDPETVEPCARLVAQLRARIGVYAVLGNHDYCAGAAHVASALARHGVTVLVNEAVRVAESLWLCGLDDDRLGRPDPAAALGQVPRDDAAIVLMHNPGYVENLPDRPMLVLAGHTHGGQIRLPGLTRRELRRIGAGRYRAGWYSRGAVRMYVNRGIGNVGFPLRFRARPEVTRFTLLPSS